MLEYIHIDQKVNGSKPTIFLSMSRASDRRLIKKNMPEHYAVVEESDTSPTELKYDLYITDLHSYKKNRKKLLELKEQALPVFIPIVLLVENSKILNHNSEIWAEIDDVIEIPVPMKMLNMRIQNQLRSRKSSLQIARQNEKLHILEKAIHSTDVGVSITDAQAENNPIIFSNQGFTKLTGYSREEILGKNCRFLQNDDRDQKELDDIRDLIQTGQSCRRIIRNYKKDGTQFWNELSIAPVKNSKGDVTHFIGIQNDVTELVETQKELKEEKDLLRLVTENSTDMISRHSLDGTYLYVTPSSEQLLGYTPEELVGKNAFDYFHPDDLELVDEAHKVLHKNPGNDESVTVSYRKKTKSGKYKWVETVSRASLNPEDNTIVEIQSNTRDISTRKKHEQELEYAVHEKNVLLQEIHHRVKNNLAVISGLLQIQQFETEDEALNKVLGNSVSRIKSMALIHEKLYRSKSLSHLEFDDYLKDLVSTISRSHAHNNEFEIQIDSDKTILNVNQGVPCALILNELISNAIEHAFVGREQGTIWVSLKEKNDRLTASVKDDGIGFPEGLLKERRQSMGLTIIQTLIKQLHSELEVTVENGTEFSFSFDKQNIKGAHSRFV